ncbi:hypothetical protein MC7420_2209 [Coleofasciculus chthonoplastes PCC 7420]|uniref:Uncharacterized protein n=1 Tax=Coleofasciculus chthonoplastes PCC 7420 TaxID=118168 RepID=B4VS19_9CYAN|nr:hypothetical protein [Coleofasciculus chthonoplastes]EDX75205.1 hypothetical protein MC7420_2209 [Coleofasciculus chthonoplastes PCC 7420]
MTQSQPPLPQPQLDPQGITFDQYAEFTPEKLELSNGYLGYGGQDQTGFHLAVLTNMGLLAAIQHIGVSLWVDALNHYLRQRLEAVNAEPEVAEAMINRLNRAIEDLEAIAEYFVEIQDNTQSG